MRIGSITLALMGVPMLLTPELLLSLFLHDEATLSLAVAPLRLVGATIGIDAVGLVLLNAMYGAGNSRPVFVVGTLLQWGVGLPLAYLFGPVLGLGLLWMWVPMMLYWCSQAAIFAAMWKGRKWANIAV